MTQKITKIHKESKEVFETLIKKQVKVFSNSKDLGVPYNRLDLPDDVKRAILFVRTNWSWTISRKGYGDINERGVEVRMRIMEKTVDDIEEGTKYIIQVYSSLKPLELHPDCNAIIAISSTPYNLRLPFP